MSGFDCPPERKEGLEEVKRAVGIHHHYLDGWIYLFYENKKFDFNETVAKLQRRDNMEKTVFASYTITPSLKQSMRAGIVQYIGRDKVGRPVLFFNTARDSPTADQRPERQANLDMFLSWAVRCDPMNPTATVTWLINQQDASLMRNTDLIFQKDMALRISKFFPGVVAKMYICNMGSALTFVMRPLLKQLPKSISECIFFFSGGDIRRGKLLEVIDAEVLPIAMGGTNNIDHKQNHELFAATIEGYFGRCTRALQEGISVKQMEMMEAYPVDKDGKPLAVKESQGDSTGQTASLTEPPLSSPSTLRASRIQAAGEETLDLASPIPRAPSAIRVNRDNKEVIVVMASTLRRRAEPASHASGGPLGAGEADADGQEEQADSSFADLFSPSIGQPSQSFPLVRKDAQGSMQQSPNHAQKLTFFHTDSQQNLAADDAGKEKTGTPELDACGLPVLHVDTIEVFSFSKNVPAMRLSQEKTCDLQRCWALFLCHCVTLLPQLCLLMESLRDEDMLADEIVQVHESIPLIRRVMHHVLDLFPQTTQPLHYPIFHWLSAGHGKKGERSPIANASGAVKDRVAMDCTSPDNFLLSVQGASVEYVDECERLLEEDKMKDRVLRRVILSWPDGVTYDAVVGGLKAKVSDLWRQVVPLFQKYIEAKVAMSIGEFIDYYGLLASGGKIDTSATWYSSLYSGLVQYRELHRKNWLFHVFPPPFNRSREARRQSDPAATAPVTGMDEFAPTMREMLNVRGGPVPTLTAVCEFVRLVERSLQGTREQLGPSSVARLATHMVVERFMEETGTKVYIPYESQLTGFKPKELIAAERVSARQILEVVEAPLREFLSIASILFVLEGGDLGGSNGGRAFAGVRSSPPTRKSVLQRVNAARHLCQDMVESRRGSRRTAVAIAKAAYEVQGTFGSDTGGPGGGPLLPVYGDGDGATSPITGPSVGGVPHAPVRPDGYALALDLLLVGALASQHATEQAAPVNDSFARSPESGLGRPASPSSHSAGYIDFAVQQRGLADVATPAAATESDSGRSSDDDGDLKSICSAEAVDVAAFIDTIAAMDAAAIPLVTSKRLLTR